MYSARKLSYQELYAYIITFNKPIHFVTTYIINERCMLDPNKIAVSGGEPSSKPSCYFLVCSSLLRSDNFFMPHTQCMTANKIVN